MRTQDATAVAVCAALWAVLNVLLSPVFWQLMHMPFLCDLLAFASLVLVVWWTRKFGSASMTGLIVAVLTFIIRPGSFYMLGFLAASIAFDLITKAIGYARLFSKSLFGSLSTIALSTISAALAGAIIGSFFMSFTTPIAVATFVGLHAVGGLIGGAIGVITISALAARQIAPYK